MVVTRRPAIRERAGDAQLWRTRSGVAALPARRTAGGQRRRSRSALTTCRPGGVCLRSSINWARRLRRFRYPLSSCCWIWSPRSPVPLLSDLEEFVISHGPHGTLTGDATEPAWNGYLLTVACPCSVLFARWVTP